MKSTQLLTIALACLARSAFAQLPELGSPSTLSGASTTARFLAGATSDGGLTYQNDFAANRAITVQAEIGIEPAHIGSAGNLYVIALYQGQYFVQDELGGFGAWDLSLAGLLPTRISSALQSSEALTVFQDIVFGSFVSGRADLSLFYAYDSSITPGQIYYSGEPLLIGIDEAQTLVQFSRDSSSDLNLPPGGDNGSYDSTVATDPETGRVWMIFSRVEGSIGNAFVSTHLAYSDDGGGSWQYSALINQAEEVAPEDAPLEFPNAVEARWQHETPGIAYDPDAPAGERWRIIWHRYLHVDDGVPDNEDRKFLYGWAASKSAATPALLAAAGEEKLFGTAGYHLSDDIQAYNDAVLGAPRFQLEQLHPNLADSLAVSEFGMQAFDGDLYVSFVSNSNAQAHIELIRLDHGSNEWSYVGRPLSAADAPLLDPDWDKFSATDLFIQDSQAYLLVSPVSQLYQGTLLFKLDLLTGEVERDLTGKPNVILAFARPGNAIQTGVSTYDPGLTEAGILIGDALPDPPQFRMYATGIKP